MTFHAQILLLDKKHFNISNMRWVIKWAKRELFVCAVGYGPPFADYDNFMSFEEFEFSDTSSGRRYSNLSDEIHDHSSYMEPADYCIGFAIPKDPSWNHLFVMADVDGYIEDENDWLYSNDGLYFRYDEPIDRSDYFYTHIGKVDESKLDDAFSQALLLSIIKGSSEFLTAVS